MFPYHLKSPQEITLITIIWIEYGNNYQLFRLPESEFNVYLCN